jgi:hypothetical protein
MYAFTLPFISKVHSPAGIIIPAFAEIADKLRTAPAAVFRYILYVYSYINNIE